MPGPYAHPCPQCQRPRRRTGPGHRGGFYYYCARCQKATLIGEPVRPPIAAEDADGRYRHQNRDGALAEMLRRYENREARAPQLAEEQGVTVRSIYRRLRWMRENRERTPQAA